MKINNEFDYNLFKLSSIAYGVLLLVSFFGGYLLSRAMLKTTKSTAIVIAVCAVLIGAAWLYSMHVFVLPVRLAADLLKVFILAIIAHWLTLRAKSRRQRADTDQRKEEHP